MSDEHKWSKDYSCESSTDILEDIMWEIERGNTLDGIPYRKGYPGIWSGTLRVTLEWIPEEP